MDGPKGGGPIATVYDERRRSRKFNIYCAVAVSFNSAVHHISRPLHSAISLRGPFLHAPSLPLNLYPSPKNFSPRKQALIFEINCRPLWVKATHWRRETIARHNFNTSGHLQARTRTLRDRSNSQVLKGSQTLKRSHFPMKWRGLQLARRCHEDIEEC